MLLSPSLSPSRDPKFSAAPKQAPSTLSAYRGHHWPFHSIAYILEGAF